MKFSTRILYRPKNGSQSLFMQIYICINRISEYNYDMQLTRKQIIEYLNSNHSATALELSRTLNVTAANIRHHISELIRQEIVEEIGNIHPEGRGRPTKLYSLTKGALNHNLDFLADSLLQIFANVLSGAENNHIELISRQMLKGRNIPENHIQRLNQAILWLNSHNYQSRWEASLNGPRVSLGFCPYAAILDANPVLCQIDTVLVSQLVGSRMEQLSRLEHSPSGKRQCVFAIHPQNS